MKSIEKKIFVCACTYNNNLNRKWFIKYKVADYIKAEFVVKKYTGQINLYNSIAERQQEIERIKLLIDNNQELPKFQGVRKLRNYVYEANFSSTTKLFFDALEKRKHIINATSFIHYKSKIKTLESWLLANNFTHLPIVNLSEEIANSFLTDLIEKKYANSTINSFKTLFGSLTQFVYDQKNINKINVWKSIEALPEKNNPFLPYTAEIENIIAKELPKDTQHWLFMQFTYYGYIRGVEQQKLKLKNIDFFNKCIRVDETKNKKSKTVVLPDHLINLLIELGYDKLPKEYYIFSKKSVPDEKKIGKNYFSKKWKFFCKKNNIPEYYKSYGTKPTGIIKQRRNNRDTKDIQMQADHHSLDQTDKYLRTMDATHLEDFRNSFLKIGEQPIKKMDRLDNIENILREVLEKLK